MVLLVWVYYSAQIFLFGAGTHTPLCRGTDRSGHCGGLRATLFPQYYQWVKTSRIVPSLAVLVIALAAAYLIYPPFRLWALVVAGHSPVCPMCACPQKQSEY